MIYASSDRQGGDSGNRRDGDAITDRNDSEGASNTNSLPSTAAMENKAMQGRIILLFVSFLYGTLNVSLRAIYATDGAPVASVLSFTRQCLSVLIFIPIYIATEQSKHIYEKGDDDKDTNTNTNVGDGKRKEGEEEAIKPMLLAGLELALWNFGAQGFVTAGLLSSPAARASFLTQTSVVMTPLLSALAGEKIKSSVWGGCGLALCGLFLISTTTSTGDVIEGSTIDSALSTINVSQGDVLILDTTWSLVMVNVYLSYVKTCKQLQRSRPSIHKDGIVSSNVWWMVFVYCRNDNFIRHISGVERSNNTPLVRME